MTLQRPEAALSIGGRRMTAAQAALTRLVVELALGRRHDRFSARFGPSSPFGDASAGSAAVVELGYGESLSTVLTGTVTAVERHPTRVVVEGLAATLALSRTRVGRSYLSQSASDIVSDLAGTAQTELGDVSSSLQLAAYHVDERRSAWVHVGTLAALSGAEVSADGQGALNFRPPRTGSPSHTLRRGAELVEWDLGPRTDTSEAVSVVPFGAASEQGPDHWHVILREPDGGAPSQPTLVPGALHDEDAAGIYAQAIGDARARRSMRGSAVITGDPTVRAGDIISLTDVPGAAGRPLRVTAATHSLSGLGGFYTQLELEGVA